MLIRYLLKNLALPPAVNILVILFALVFLRQRPKLKLFLICLSALSLAILAMPVTSQFLARGLETYPALDMEQINPGDYQAIIILGAGRQRGAEEYGADVPTAAGLERLRYGALLHRSTGLPILVSGGKWSQDKVSEAEFMAQVLQREFMVPVRWQERRSRTTWENARYSRQLAIENKLQQVLLVTHAWHMPRSVYSFQQAGMRVTPAPTGFKSRDREHDALDYTPQAGALLASSLMLHEWLGLIWYRLAEQ